MSCCIRAEASGENSTVRSYGFSSSSTSSSFTVTPRIYFTEGDICEIANKPKKMELSHKTGQGKKTPSQPSQVALTERCRRMLNADQCPPNNYGAHELFRSVDGAQGLPVQVMSKRTDPLLFGIFMDGLDSAPVAVRVTAVSATACTTGATAVTITAAAAARVTWVAGVVGTA